MNGHRETRPNRWRVRVQSKGQKLDQVIKGPKSSAIALQAQTIMDMRKQVFVPPQVSNIPFDQFVREVFLPDRTSRLKASTLERESWVLTRLIEAWDKRPLASISRLDVKRFLDNSPNSARTKVRELAVITVMFKTAMEKEMLFKNPCAGFRFTSDQDDDSHPAKEYPSQNK